MRGFDNKALILFPPKENVDSKGSVYMYRLKLAINNLMKYLASVGISPHMFYTDDVARSIMLDQEIVWVSTIGEADRFFCSRYCDGMSDAMTRKMLGDEKLFNDIIAKAPGSPKMGVEERFELVLQHSMKAAKELIKKYKIVIDFRFPNRDQYKVQSKQGDGKIRIFVSTQTLVPHAELSGNVENICDLLCIPCASRSLDQWEV